MFLLMEQRAEPVVAALASRVERLSEPADVFLSRRLLQLNPARQSWSPVVSVQGENL